MGKKGKILLFVFLLLLASIVLVHVQARRVMLALIETQAADNVETKIGTIQLRPLRQTILLKDVSVSINDKDSPGFREASVKRVHLEMGSLWAFFFGGTLVIDKMECDGGELIMARSSVREPDATAPESFDLSVVFDRLRKNAIRFRIQEMSFRDFSLTLLNDSTNSPTLVKHLQFRARDLYLSADSILKRMPYIECGLPSQQIIFPNGTTTIKFDSLFFSTSDNSIQLNEAELVMNDGESGSQYRINSDKVRVAYFDFESLFTKGMTIVDSIFLGSSKLEAKINVQQRSKTVNKNAPSNNTLPYLLVRNLMVRQLAAKVQLKQQEIENSFTINHSSVTIQNLEHSPDSSQRLSSTSFDILISDYETLLNNKNTSITFDTVRLHRHGLALLNFNISKAAQAKPILQTAVFELRDVDWYTLLFFKKLVAKEAIAVNPIVNTTFMAPAGEGGSSQELVVLESLKELLDVNLFSLKNASANLRFDEGRTTAALKGINASILVNRMIESKTLNDALDATPEFTFRTFALKSNDMEGRIEDFTLQQGKLYFGNVDFADGDKLDLKLKELNLDHIVYDDSRNNLAVSGLVWQSAVLRIKSNTGNGTSTNRRLPEISLSMLKGKNTQVHYSSQDLIANVYFDGIQTNILLLGDSITVGGVHIVGNSLNINKDSASLSVKRFSFAENGSVVENIQWNRNGADTLYTAIEQISFVTDFNLLARQKFFFPRVDVTGWSAAYQKRDSSHTTLIKVKANLLAKDVRYEKKKFILESLHQTFDSVYYLDEKRMKKPVEVVKNTPVNERWKIRDDVDSIFDTGNSVGVLLPISAKGARPSFGTPAESPFSMLSTKVESGQNSLAISVSNIEAFSKDSALQVTGQVDSIRFREIHFHHNDIHTRIDHGAVKGLSVHSGWVKQPMEMLRANYPTAAIVNLKLHVETDKNVFKFDRLDYDPLRAAGSIKGLEVRPVKDKQAFLDESFFQTNYMHTKIESLSFEKWDPERYLNDSTIHLRVIRVNGPGLEIGRDKTHPFYSSRIKLLPTNSFQKLGVKFKVDSLQIQNGNITYTEKSKVTSKEGLIHFTNVQGLVRNIKNVEMKTMDTLFLEASARFLDSAKVNLRVRESYHDTLAGFLMTTQVSPFHTSILNPVLVPLVSVEFQSGFVDTLQMHALGREHIALGRMKFLYRDLKVNFLDQNDTSRHSIKNYILKVAANNLVIKTNNKKRIGDVMELRDRHRAVFQYWVKMILSGVTTSVGAKSNRSQMKKYSRELNTRKLPPIEVPLAGF